MILFIDDWRDDNRQDVVIVRSYETAITMLKAHTFMEVSLDYDLNSDHTGLDIAAFMMREEIFPEKIVVHSGHPWGSSQIYDLLKSRCPEHVEIEKRSMF